MPEFNFVLKFAFDHPDTDPADYVQVLEESGCDDAVVGIGKLGRIALDFGREAATAEEALYSAVADVRRAIPGIHLVEAAPDLVGLTEIAALLGQTRQNARRILQTDEAFPRAVHEGTSALFHLADVYRWMDERGKRVDTESRAVALASQTLNTARDIGALSPHQAALAQGPWLEAIAR
ncbi:hypothetical protein [Luteibacter sp. 9133]|uniref:helix-turn-helix transcriptional regulator n=1 Tax=Luteibacter sp. 9133 TaxID=1500891 RepID=UPI00068CBEE9|nr:hypothetical protein [Luteibacter sp. 9133]